MNKNITKIVAAGMLGFAGLGMTACNDSDDVDTTEATVTEDVVDQDTEVITDVETETNIVGTETDVIDATDDDADVDVDDEVETDK